MYSLAFLAVVSFVLSFVLTPLVRNLFRRCAIGMNAGTTGFDVHSRPIPRAGGIAILAAYLLSYGLLLALKLRAGLIIWDSTDFTIRLLPAAGLMFFVGFLHDVRRLEPWQKILGQLAAASLAWWAGVRLSTIGGTSLGFWALPATILWIFVCSNAIKLIDGVDGLAAGLGFFAAATTLLMALLRNNIELALAIVPLAGALLGFLRYNFNPATVFLGDSGSLSIGFLLACFGVIWSQKAATLLAVTAPLITLAIPLVDSALAIARRFLRRQPLFEADQGHIHHRLLSRGLSPRRVALLLYAVAGLCATASVLIASTGFAGIIVIIFCIVTWLGVQHLGYVEFGLASRMLVEGAFRRMLNAQLTLQYVEKQLESADTLDQIWSVVTTACREFGFTRAEWPGRFLWTDENQPVYAWDITVPVSETESIRLQRSFGPEGQPNAVAPFVDLLRRRIGPKLVALRQPNADRHLATGV